MTIAASTEPPAAERFSARIDSEDGMAGLPDMQELSLLRAESAKQIAPQQIWFVVDGKRMRRFFLAHQRS
jgi:hypothetical protein